MICLLLGLRPGIGGAEETRLRLRLQADTALDFRQVQLRTDVTGSRVHLVLAAGPSIAFSLTDRALRFGTPPDSGLAQQGPVDAALRQVLEGGPLPAPIAAVHPSGDGRLAIAALTDGTLRWFTADTGRPLLSLYLHPDRKRWILWTPSGYYDASTDGDGFVGWELPRDPAQHLPPDRFRVGLFRDSARRPDLVNRVLFARDEVRALEELDAESGRKEPTTPLMRRLPPVIRVLSPARGSVVSSPRIDVRFSVRSPSGEPVTAVRVLVRGADTLTRGVGAPMALSRALRVTADEEIHTESVELPGENATVVLRAETALAAAEPVLLPLRWGGPPKEGALSRPDLYVLAIGVADYRDPRLRLDYAAKDARALADAFSEQQGKRFRHVEAHTVVDGHAGREQILAELAWLRRAATPFDVSAIFLAGHGITDPATGQYHFLPHEGDPGRADTLVSGEALRAALSQIPGKVVLFLDTCHAGKVDLTRLSGDISSPDSGVVVYAASTAGQTSRESVRWGHGAFTLAATEGLRGRADYAGNGRITVSALEQYISARVRELTHEQQVPTSAKPGTVPDFLLASVKVRYKLERKWWFWGAVGLGAAAVIGGTLAATRPWEAQPMRFDFEGATP